MEDRARGFVFYPQDYFGDSEVRFMPGHLRIVWVEAFFMMHESPRPGVLLHQNGDPYNPGELAIKMNLPVGDIEAAFAMVLQKGIASIDAATKALMCRRMVRDAEKRHKNTENGRKGGNPSLKTAESVNRSVKAKTDPEPDPEPDPELDPKPESERIPGDCVDRARKTRAPATISITESMRQWAYENGVTVDLDAETAVMLDHHRGKGNLHLDWIATWRTWMRNTKRYGGQNGRVVESAAERRSRRTNEAGDRAAKAVFESLSRRLPAGVN